MMMQPMILLKRADVCASRVGFCRSDQRHSTRGQYRRIITELLRGRPNHGSEQVAVRYRTP